MPSTTSDPTLPPTTTHQTTTVPTTTPPEDAVPPELEGNWRGDHSTGDVVNLSLRGTRWSLEVAGGVAVGGDLSVVGDTIVFFGVYECPGEFEYAWLIEDESLTLTPIDEDPCPRGGYLDGVVFTR